MSEKCEFTSVHCQLHEHMKVVADSEYWCGCVFQQQLIKEEIQQQKALLDKMDDSTSVEVNRWAYLIITIILRCESLLSIQ